MDWELAEQLRIAEEIERRKEAERSAIRAEISGCELQREDIRRDIEKLTAKVEAQEAARAKYKQIYERYEDGRYHYAAKLEQVAVYREDMKMLPGHESMIRECVQGSKAQQAMSYMSNIEDKMVSEITKNLDLIENLQSQLCGLNQRIESLYQQLWSI